MRRLRSALAVAYAGILVLAAALCTWGIARTAWLLGVEPAHIAAGRAGACVPLLVLTLAYGLILWRRGFGVWAPAWFVLSFVSIGAAFEFWIRWYVKGFAPDGGGALLLDYLTGISTLAVVVTGAVALAVKTGRSAAHSR